MRGYLRVVSCLARDGAGSLIAKSNVVARHYHRNIKAFLSLSENPAGKSSLLSSFRPVKHILTAVAESVQDCPAEAAR